MADNTTLNLGTGGDVIATDDIGGVKYPIGKVAFGPLDTATLVTSAVGLPVNVLNTSIAVTGPLTDAQLRASAVPVSGTFFQATQPISAAALPLPAGAATEATLAAQSAKLPAALVGGRLDVNIGASVAIAATQSGTWTVQPGNTPNTTPWLVTDTPATTGGVSVSSFLSTVAVQSTAIKASAGQVYGLQFFNTNAAPRYVRLYNQTASPASTDGANIIWRGVIPGNTTGAGFVVPFDKGLAFSAGIGLRVTTGAADNDAGALGASEVIGNVTYK
jgi:hypothetical protein